MGTKFVTYNALQHLHVAYLKEYLNTGDKPAFVRRLHPQYASRQVGEKRNKAAAKISSCRL